MDDVHDRLIEGLLRRGLVQIAEQECLRRMQDERLSDRDRVDWTVRLSKAYCRHAELSSGPDREAFWTRAEQMLTASLEQGVPAGLREPILVQQAIVKARRAAMLHWEVRLVGAASVSDDERYRMVQQLVDELTQLRSQLQKSLDEARQRPGDDSEILSPADLRQLIQRVDLSRAQTLVDAAEFPDPRRDVEQTLAEADRLLKSIAKGWTGDPMTWEARQLRVRIARIAGKRDKVLQLVRTALADRPANWLADRFQAEQIRAELSAGNLDVALETLVKLGRERGRLSDELITLFVEVLLDSRQLALQSGNQQLADDLQQKALAWAGQAKPPWKMRADWLLARTSEEETYGPEIAALLRAGRAAFQRGDVPQALDAYRQASREALDQNQPALADEFDMLRGSILSRQQAWDEALGVFESILQRGSAGDELPKAGLMAAFVRGKLFENDPTPQHQRDYAQALEAHRKRFPNDPTNVDATWMLAVLEEHRQQWTKAISLYQEIADTPQRGGRAQLRMAILLDQILSRLRELRQPPDEWEDHAVRLLSGFVNKYPPPPEQLSLQQAEVALRLARILMNHRRPDFLEAERLLTRVQQTVRSLRREQEAQQLSLSLEWEKMALAAIQLRAVALAAQGKIEQTRKLLLQQVESSPRQTLELLAGLGRVARDLPVEARTSLGQLQLQMARTIEPKRSSLTDEEKQQLDVCLIEANIAVGTPLNALSLLEKRIQQNPRDAVLLKTAAELYSQQTQPRSQSRARELWQRFAETQPKGSHEWLAARYEIALSLTALGKKQEAKKLIRLTRLLYPELGGTKLRESYEALEQSLDENRTPGRPPS